MMRSGKLIITVSAVFFAWAVNIFAGDEGTTAASYLKIPMSARATAMAGAFCSQDAGASSLFWNPATLGLMQKKEITMTYNKWLMDTSYSFVGFADIMSPGYAMAFGVNLLDGGQIQSTDTNGELAGWTDHASAFIFSVCNGFTLSKNFYAGFGAKFIAEDIAVYERTVGGTGDVGFLVTPIPGRLNIGISAQNISPGMTPMQDNSKNYMFPLILRAGATIVPKKDVANISVDLMNDETGNRISLGAEFVILDTLALRGGYRLQLSGNNAVADSINTVTAGFGIKIKSMSFDFAVMPHSEKELGTTMQASLGLRFGSRIKPVKKKAEAQIAGLPATVPVEKPETVPEPDKTRVPDSERINLAVMSFNASELSSAESSFVTELFRDEISKYPKLRLVAKENMDKILAEQGFQQTGCTTEECVIQMGKVLNVKYMVNGSIGKSFGKYYLIVKLVSVETAEIIFSDKTINLEASQEALTNAAKLLTFKLQNSLK